MPASHKGTGSRWQPDSWILQRNVKRLICNTGEHPLNAEPTVDSVLDNVFTPSQEHYVRNHGDVPRLSWEAHTIELIGMPSDDGSENRCVTVHMSELADMNSVEIPLTFACDGNRRKEVNATGKRSNGFDWGPAAVATSVYKGVLLRDVLLRYFGEEGLQGARFVLFEGGPDEHITHGPYGTSIPISVALDSTADALLAYGLNGEQLPPDHGFPLRCILPGMVGGRMCKWLYKIALSATESENPHHLYDNKVLPPEVSNPAIAQGYWKDPQYVLYELNINSVILAPGHAEQLAVRCSADEYTLQGYAYTGGGRQIRRVEISLNGGADWTAATVRYPEGYAPRHGTRWWVMARWELAVPVWKFLQCSEIAVRAWDSSLNTQPNNIKWNLLGMMNNAWYRVKVAVTEEPLQKGDAPKIQFKHPVAQTGEEEPGWMEETGRGGRAREFSEKVPGRVYSAQEVATHNKRDDCWIIIDKKVYDVTSFLSQHPGGVSTMLVYGGRDASAVFASIHADDAYALKSSYLIGRLAEQQGSDDKEQKHVSQRKRMPNLTPDGKPIALSTRHWTKVTLQHREELTADVRRFVFALPSPEYRLWMPWGKHVNLAVQPNELDMTVRPYTPTRPVLAAEDDGTFELVIKIYFPTPSKPGGEMTTLLESMRIGDEAQIRGPEGRISYNGRGVFDIEGHFLHATHVNFIVGGTGLTPAYAILRAILLAESDDGAAETDAETAGHRPRVAVRMVFANKSPADILLLKELQELASRFSDRFRIWHVIAEVPADTDNSSSAGSDHTGSTDKEKGSRDSSSSSSEASSALEDVQGCYSTGRVNQRVLEQQLFEADSGAVSLVCGPPPFVNLAVVPALQQLGFDEDHLFEF